MKWWNFIYLVGHASAASEWWDGLGLGGSSPNSSEIRASLSSGDLTVEDVIQSRRLLTRRLTSPEESFQDVQARRLLTSKWLDEFAKLKNLVMTSFIWYMAEDAWSRNDMSVYNRIVAAAKTCDTHNADTTKAWKAKVSEGTMDWDHVTSTSELYGVLSESPTRRLTDVLEYDRMLTNQTNTSRRLTFTSDTTMEKSNMDFTATIAASANHSSNLGPIRWQGWCGSCWAFATAAVIQASAKLDNTDMDVHEISVQQLVDCAGPASSQCLAGCTDCCGAHGCAGAVHSCYAKSFSFIQKLFDAGKGLYGATTYPYECTGTSKDEVWCSSSGSSTRLGASCEMDGKGSPYVTSLKATKITSFTADQMKYYVVQRPVGGYIRVQHDFHQYSSGVYDACTSTSPNHAIVIAGYGTENGVAYWLIRNTWGDGWGQYGYAKMKRGVNMCGVETDIYIVTNVVVDKTNGIPTSPSVSHLGYYADGCQTDADCHMDLTISKHRFCWCKGATCWYHGQVLKTNKERKHAVHKNCMLHVSKSHWGTDCACSRHTGTHEMQHEPLSNRDRMQLVAAAGLAVGAIVGIVIGVVCFCCGVGACGYKKKMDMEKAKTQELQNREEDHARQVHQEHVAKIASTASAQSMKSGGSAYRASDTE
eukprot:gnl/MRDRNA2_/MRDRNA2_33645_c0_seq1.p1 gnl/MRDRNA2_/MRDRNA2_33645_c0~~gnl/MRDRNA2_/MRDRNA2_33645_c0_seq1.p1  ORF type:complete len:647 (-),score=83.38 gnl/MRDRNA2_/MRDRNA2_33645_c0_seq1:26-1966(-)